MKKFLTTSLILMLLLIFGVTFVLTRSLSPYNQAEAEATAIANRQADLTETEDFYWFNGNETFFTVTGTDSEGTNIIVIVQQDGGSTQIYNEADTVSEQEVIDQTFAREEPSNVLEARIGIYDSNPIWEVSFEQADDSIGYAIYSLTSGEWIRTIKNI